MLNGFPKSARRGYVMKIHLRLFVAVASIVCLFAPRLDATPNDAEQVRKVVTGFSAAWNRHDMEAFGKLFAVDADFVNVAGAWMKGRDDIQMHHAYSHGTIPADTQIAGARREHYGIFKSSTMQFTKVDVRFLRKDVAIAHVSWDLLGDSRTPNPRRGLLTFVLTRQDSQWLIASGQNTEIERTVK